MDDANSLRTKGRAVGVEVMIAKKTLLNRALEQNGFTIAPDDLEGSILTTIGFDDEVAAAKLMAEFAKDRETIQIVGGILEGKFVGTSAIKQLSSLQAARHSSPNSLAHWARPSQDSSMSLLGTCVASSTFSTLLRKRRPNHLPTYSPNRLSLCQTKQKPPWRFRRSSRAS